MKCKIKIKLPSNYRDKQFTFEVPSSKFNKVLKDLEDDKNVRAYTYSHDNSFYKNNIIVHIKYNKFTVA